jgi:hypothetical protein
LVDSDSDYTPPVVVVELEQEYLDLKVVLEPDAQACHHHCPVFVAVQVVVDLASEQAVVFEFVDCTHGLYYYPVPQQVLILVPGPGEHGLQ